MPGCSDPSFSVLARLAASACGAHFAAIAIAGGETWCTASAKLPSAAVPGCDPFADSTLQAADLFEVPDSAADDRFRKSELVAGTLAIRSYAGCALRTRSGDVLGTLAVYHKTARFLSQEQRASLSLIGEQVVARAEVESRLLELALLSDAPPAPALALLQSAPVADVSHGRRRQLDLQQSRIPPHVRSRTGRRARCVGSACSPR